MKLTNRTAIEVFGIGKKDEYNFIRDILLPSLSKECGIPFILNGFISLEKKENLKPPSSTGVFFVYTDAQKMPLSINKMVSDSVVKLNIPAIFSNSKDPTEIKNEIYEAIPAFSVYCETAKLFKKDYPTPRAFSFKDFQDLLLESKEKTLDFFPCDEIYNSKTHGDNLLKFIQEKVDSLCTKELVLTPHGLLNYFRDIPYLIQDEPENDFVIQFTKNWFYGAVKHYEDKDLSFFIGLYERHFETQIRDVYKNYLISLLPNYKEKETVFTLDIQGLNLTYSKGVILNIKEIYSTHIITDGSISIDSTSHNKISNLSIDCNALV